MRHTATLCLTLMLSLAACQQKQAATVTTNEPPAQVTTTAQAVALTPEQLGELGAQIKNAPARADELLAHHNLTRESFEKAVRDVTENVDASKRYAAAYKKTVV
jgi:membrane-bound lytic murein transglycosylase